MIKYQDSICNSIFNSIELGVMPHTVLFIGDVGCGKHSLANEISLRLGFEIEDITDNVDNEKIDAIYLSAIQRVYTANIDLLSVKEQNSLLKFIEEPSESAYIILFSSSKTSVLSTIYNRCIVYTFSGYTKEQISDITGITDDTILAYSNTPGKAEQFKDCGIAPYIEYIDRMLTLIDKASYANILKLESKLYFKEKEENKLSFDKMCYVLLSRAYDLYADKKISYKKVQAVMKFTGELRIPKIDRKNLFYSFIFELKGAAT